MATPAGETCGLRRFNSVSMRMAAMWVMAICTASRASTSFRGRPRQSPPGLH
jgi:hypothetical protein